MKDIPFVAYGNNELENNPSAAKGDLIVCPGCKGNHEISYGKDENGIESDLIMFYKCGKKSFLAGVNGNLIPNIQKKLLV